MVGNKFCFDFKISLITKANYYLFLLVAFLKCSLLAQGNSEIVLGSIESELEKKQVPIDLGNTPKMISSIVGKAIKIHGGLRLASAKESRFSATFTSRGQNEIQVSIASGFPKKVSST